MNYESIAILVGALLTIGSVVVGAKYNQGKNKAKKCYDVKTGDPCIDSVCQSILLHQVIVTFSLQPK
jgi:hypothetical protein